MCFETKEDLQSAVDYCASPTTQNDPDCNAVKLTYGWPMGTWCFEDTVTSMYALFKGKIDFNEDISNWDVSRVVDMTMMFYDAYNFNQNISGWVVTSVTKMNTMFRNARKFNQDISIWDISAVTEMQSTFRGALDFNQNLCKYSCL